MLPPGLRPWLCPLLALKWLQNSYLESEAWDNMGIPESLEKQRVCSLQPRHGSEGATWMLEILRSWHSAGKHSQACFGKRTYAHVHIEQEQQFSCRYSLNNSNV